MVRILSQRGAQISGSELRESAVLDRLRRENIECRVGHAETNVTQGVNLLLVSAAIDASNPEVRAARNRSIPVLKRGEMLAETLSGKKLVAIVGSHGKSTVVGMLISALRHNRFEFGYVLGALFCGDNPPPAKYSEVPWVIAEIDESDGTIEKFSPEITVVVNLDWDHPDFYDDAAEMEEARLRG